jgi:hypothetical protein
LLSRIQYNSRFEDKRINYLFSQVAYVGAIVLGGCYNNSAALPGYVVKYRSNLKRWLNFRNGDKGFDTISGESNP